MSAFKSSWNKALTNYKAIIPTYNVKDNSICMLFPICLVSGSSVDAAILVAHNENGTYQVHTVLTLAMAYQDSRLIGKQDVSWLDAKKISTL